MTLKGITPKSDFFKRDHETAPLVDPIPRITMNAPLSDGFVTPVKGDIGIEAEYEGMRLPTEGSLERVHGPVSKARWTAIRDGSLRDGGLEYVLTRPCFVSEVSHMVLGMFEVMENSGTTFRLTNRTSTHVHVNVSDLKVNEITSIIVLWSAFEEAIVNSFGDMRRSNHFCLTNDSSCSMIEAWEELLDSGTIPHNDGIKYSALNVLPIWRFGSLEFRAAPAFASSDEMIAWVNFCHSLKTYAVERFANPTALGVAVSENGGATLFRDICKMAEADTFCDAVIQTAGGEEGFNDMVMMGLRRVQAMIYHHPWQEWIDSYINLPRVNDPFKRPPKIAKKMKTTDIRFGGLRGEVVPPPPDPLRRVADIDRFMEDLALVAEEEPEL